MPKIAKWAIAVAALIAVFIVSIPFLLSSDYVKERIAGQVFELTGLDMKLNGGSLVSLSPYLGVSYSDVRIIGEPGKEPLIEMDTMHAKLNVFSVLQGDARVSELRFVRPRFKLENSRVGYKNWKFNEGAIANRVNNTISENSAALPLGKLILEDGLIEYDDAISRNTKTLTGVNGDIIWSDVVSPVSVRFEAVWRGEVVNINSNATSPLALLQGGNSNVFFKIASNPLNLEFSGEISGTDGSSTGNITLASPSVRRLLDWIDNPISAARALGAVQISGPVSAKANQVEFSEAALKIGEHNGVGRLQFMLQDDGIPAINGTLAFETLTLPDLASITIENTAENAEQTAVLDLSVLQGFSMDVRLSSDTATANSISLSGLAAALIVRDGKAGFDIGHADFLSGGLSGSVSLEQINDKAGLAVDVAMSDVDLEALARLAGDAPLALRGNGDVAFAIKSTGGNSRQLVRRMNGKASVRSTDGTLVGMDVASLMAEPETPNDPMLSELSGSTPYSKLDFQMLIANGTAFLRGSTIQADGLLVEIGGRSDLAKGGMALRGRILKTDSDGQMLADGSLPFFVGGTGSAPLVAPLRRNGRMEVPETVDGNEVEKATTPSQ